MSLVSIIMPFLDPDVRFFQEAIESVLVQSHPDWELILVDDGSGEAAREVAARMAKDHADRLTVLHHPGYTNHGASASRNLGIRHAAGAFIAFLDADDIWLPHKLEEQLAVLDKNPEAAMLLGNTLYWYSWTGRAEDQGRDFLPKMGVTKTRSIEPPRCLVLSLTRRLKVPCTCSVLIRRPAVEAVGGFEESFRTLYEDQVFYAKLWLKYPILAMPDYWDLYRQHPGSMCAKITGPQDQGIARQAYLDWLADHLHKEGCHDAAVWRVLRQQRLVARVSRHARLPGRILRLSLKALEVVRRA
jgi:glycosyltransferase involved in cell wall biosynthesis